MNTRILIAALLTLVPSAMLAADPDDTPKAGLQVTSARRGTVTATVRHSVTGEPLVGIAVLITNTAAQDPDAQTTRLLTNKSGVVVLQNLENGVYSAAVNHNELRPEPVIFKIENGSHAIVTIKFNPDLD